MCLTQVNRVPSESPLRETRTTYRRALPNLTSPSLLSELRTQGWWSLLCLPMIPMILVQVPKSDCGRSSRSSDRHRYGTSHHGQCNIFKSATDKASPRLLLRIAAAFSSRRPTPRPRPEPPPYPPAPRKLLLLDLSSLLLLELPAPVFGLRIPLPATST